MSVQSEINRITGEVNTQTDLIALIKEALEGKTAVGIPLPTLINPGFAEDLLEGKQMIDAIGNVVTGVLKKGAVVKSGIASDKTIDTGLSDIEQFFIYKESQTEAGLIYLHYSKDRTYRMYASAWSSSGSKSIVQGPGGVNVDGGRVTISVSNATLGGLTANATYKWVAVGGGGGGESGVTIQTTTTQLSTGSRTISFAGLTGQPKSFSIMPTGNINLGSIRYVTGVMYDGSNTHGTYGYRSGSSATSYYSNSYFTWTYNNGTLTVNTSSSTNGGNFSANVSYMLVYVY